MTRWMRRLGRQTSICAMGGSAGGRGDKAAQAAARRTARQRHLLSPRTQTFVAPTSRAPPARGPLSPARGARDNCEAVRAARATCHVQTKPV